MSVYKELFRFAEDVESHSIQIYPDACDFGLPIKSNEDPAIKQLSGLIEMYAGSIKTHKYETGATQTIQITGYDEWMTHDEIMFTFTYIHIDSKRRKRTEPQGILYVERANVTRKQVAYN